VVREPEKKYLFDFLERLTHALGEAIGKNCELVLHDFSEPEKSVVAIANGHVTGRKVGDTLDVLGFQLLRQPPDGDLLNYQTTKSGKVLRSSSIFLRNEQGEIFGSLCINCDLTGLLKLQEWLQGTIDAPQAGPQEEFEQSVDEVLDRLIRDAIYSTGKDISQLTRDEKIAVISYLDSKGAFLVRYSMDRIAELLSLSKYTIYNYLDEVKARQETRETVSTQGVAKQS
jgi:predicted transcriptional regulator YheO